jgi:hypothetical protein
MAAPPARTADVPDLAAAPEQIVARYNAAAAELGEHTRIALSKCDPIKCEYLLGGDILVTGTKYRDQPGIKALLFVIVDKNSARELVEAIAVTMRAFGAGASIEEVTVARHRLISLFSGKSHDGKVTLHGVNWSMMNMPEAGTWLTVEPERH